MQTVFTNEGTAHAWAHQQQDSGRNSNGSLYFSGAVIYSYGSHFPIARHVTTDNGAAAILMTTNSYSNTTASHKTQVWRAIPYQGAVFNVADVLANTPEAHAANFEDYRERVNADLKRAARARKYKASNLDLAQQTASEANRYAETFGLSDRLTIDDIDLDSLKAEIAKLDKERKEREAREREALRADFDSDVSAWQSGQLPLYSVRSRHKFNAKLRYIADTDTIETTHGADIPAEHARQVWPLLRRLHDSGKTYKRNGHSIHLGHYVIDSMDSRGTLKVGCHTIEWQDAESIAAEIGAPVDSKQSA